MTTLYRLYDNAGELLYIGIAEHWPTRMTQHARDKVWFHRIAEVRLEKHDDRASAEVDEVAAIKAESPRYNVVHSGRTRSGEDREYLRWLGWQADRLDLDLDDQDAVADAFRRHCSGILPATIAVRGHVNRYRLIVDPCPLCGGKHTHGWLDGEAEHGIAFRMPHCRPTPHVWQRIVFEVPASFAYHGHPGPAMYDHDDLDRWEQQQMRYWGHHGGAS